MGLRIEFIDDNPFLHRQFLAPAESGVRSAGGRSAVLPTSAKAAKRLGWTATEFSRKLDRPVTRDGLQLLDEARSESR